MRYFFKEGSWHLDQRRVENSDNLNLQRQIDKIKESLPCSVAEAFSIVGIFFEANNSSQIKFEKEFKGRTLIEKIQNEVNHLNVDVYVLFFDDESPVLFRGSKIELFESEDNMNFNNRLITTKLNRLGSNVVLKSYLFKPEYIRN